MFKKMFRLFTILFVFFIVQSCKLDRKVLEQEDLIVCTTSIIGDVVQQIAPEHVRIETLMGPGIDPHLYEAKPSDVRKMGEAAVIIHNGLHLEGKLSKLFKRMNSHKKLIAFEDGMNKTQLIPLTSHHYDPHVWFDVLLWLQGLTHVKEELITVYPKNKTEIQQKFKQYEVELLKLNEAIEESMDKIPYNKRVLITSHDAFHYFGKAYGVEVKAIQGVSTLIEPGLKSVSLLVNTILNRKIPAIFVESSVSSKAIKSVIEACRSKDWEVKIGGTLFSDALGSEEEQAGTYIDMITKNCQTIQKALNDGI